MLPNAFHRSALLLLCLLIAVPASAQENSQNRPWCALEEGQQTAADGSCGKWKARSVAAKPTGEKRSHGATKSRKITPTTVIDLRDLPSRGSAPVYFCVTTSHDSHQDDYLVIAAGDAAPDPWDCLPPHDGREECILHFSKHVNSICAKGKDESGRLIPNQGDLYWCVKRRKPEERSPTCKYLPLRHGQAISVWITQLHPDKTAPERQAEGTWSFIKAWR